MGIVDFHNHVMPAVDDGAQSTDECGDALSAFKADGVNVVVATPHVEGSCTTSHATLRRRMLELDRAFTAVQASAQGMRDLEVRRGVELLLNVPNPDLSDARLRLGGGPFFLMEFPYFAVPPHSAEVIRSLTRDGYMPIIAHPERYRGIAHDIDVAMRWRENGAYLQVNGGSLLGRYGNEARAAAFELLGRGWVDYLCSDYHARGPTLVSQYEALLEEIDAHEQAHLLMQVNPARMLEGKKPLPVQPLHVKRTFWRRVAGMFRS